MTVPLSLLAAGSVLVAGWGHPAVEPARGVPQLRELAGAGVRKSAAQVERGRENTSMEWTLMLVSVGIAVTGILPGSASCTTRSRKFRTASRRRSNAAYRAYNKWYVDEIYDFLFVNGLCKGGGLALAPSTATWWMAA